MDRESNEMETDNYLNDPLVVEKFNKNYLRLSITLKILSNWFFSVDFETAYYRTKFLLFMLKNQYLYAWRVESVFII